MQCSQCNEKAVINNPARCKKHFLQSFETRVLETIQRFNLLQPEETICVAASGGKDSLALLNVLHKHYKVEALAVDEGIPGYREQTLNDLRKFCDEKQITLRIVTFQDLGAKPLSEQNPEHPCSVCGVLRRKALLEYSKDYDVLVTGHNLDDEAQTILMNLLRNQQSLLARIGPRTPAREGIAARSKPFYLTPEREVRAYCLLEGITSNFSECPHIVKSFRWQVGEALNDLEVSVPGAKRRIVEEFLSRHYVDAGVGGVCGLCGGPAAGGLCRACFLVEH